LDKLESGKIKLKKNKFIIICKAINIDNLVQKYDDRITENMTLEQILGTKFKFAEGKGVIQYSDISGEKSFYFYKNKNFILPEYIIEYNLINNEQLMGLDLKQSVDSSLSNDFENLISTFTNKSEFASNFYENFNDASKTLYNSEFVRNHCYDGIRKYFPCKNVNFNELSNTTFFFIKASVIQFINLCFPYSNSIAKFNEKFYEFSENIRNIDGVANNDEFKDFLIDKINLFNFRTKDFEIFSKLVNLKDIYLCNNKLVSFDFGIIKANINVKILDISFNMIKEVKHAEMKLKQLDMSFNCIANPEDIITIISNNFELESFLFINNPLKNAKNLRNSEIKEFLTQNNKPKITLDDTKRESMLKQIDIIYDTFSFDKAFNQFSSNPLFLESSSLNDNNSSDPSSILILSKKKLKQIPFDIKSDIKILYLNINKITQIENLSALTDLQELHLQNNKLTGIGGLNCLASLTKLDLSNNMIKSIEGVKYLKALEWLNIENNLLQSLFLSEILELTGLVELHASANYISNLKECLQLKSLTNLSILDLSSNDVCKATDFRNYVIFYLQNLKILNRSAIEKGDIAAAKEYFDGRLTDEILELKIGQQPLGELIELSLVACKLKDFDNIFDNTVYAKLAKLDLSRNMFSSFKIFGYLPALKTLYLNSNVFDKIVNKKDKMIPNKGILGLPVSIHLNHRISKA
jgi:hypothetical protein